MSWIYLSHPLETTAPMYGGRKGLSYDESDRSRYARLPLHFGTHIDAPRHFVSDGKTIDVYGPDHWHFKSVLCLDVEAGPGELISRQHVEAAAKNVELEEADLILFRTGFERYRVEARYWQENPGISVDCSQWFRSEFKKLRALGLDAISVSSYQHREEGREAHRILLGQDGVQDPLVLIEDMRLSGLRSAIAEVWSLPLPFVGEDGAPCIVVAREA